MLIFGGFLLINLAIGIVCARNIGSIKEYAIGQRDFSTASIIATIVATSIAGSTFSFNIMGTYEQGIYFIAPALGDGLSLLLIAFVLAPRLKRFFGRVSVADAMGFMYGNKVRIFSAISAIIPAIGTVAIQFTVLAEIVGYFFDLAPLYAVLISAFVVISYASFGGIKAVTFTDIIQFIAFGVFIPLLLFIVWQSITDKSVVTNILEHSDLWQPTQLLNSSNPKLKEFIILCLFFAVPGLDPAFFQRAIIAKNVAQIRVSFATSALICVAIYLTLNFIGLLLYAKGAIISSDNVIPYILAEYTKPGLKIAMGIGLVAMVMSTADSYINAAAVMITNDIAMPLNLSVARYNPLLMCRISSVLVGLFALMLTAYKDSILGMLYLTYGFYMPVVSVPLLFSLFDFKTHARAVLIAMISGALSVVVMKLFVTSIDSTIPSMMVNALCLVLGTHLFPPLGGNTQTTAKIEPSKKHHTYHQMDSLLNQLAAQYEVWSKWLLGIQHNAKHEPHIIAYTGAFCMIFVIISVFSAPESITSRYEVALYNMLYGALCCTTAMIMTPLLPTNYQNKPIFSLLLVTILGYMFIAFPLILILVGNQSTAQLIVFGLGILMIFTLMYWKLAVAVIGTSTALAFYIAITVINAEKLTEYPMESEHWQALYIILCVVIISAIVMYHSHPIRRVSMAFSSHYNISPADSLQYLATRFSQACGVEWHLPSPQATDVTYHRGKSTWCAEENSYIRKMTKLMNQHKTFNGFIDNIVEYVGFASGKTILRKQLTLLTQLVDDGIDSVADINERMGSSLEVNYLDTEESIYVDPVHINTVLRNILTNALHYGTRIMITVDKTANHPKQHNCTVPPKTLITITDNGPGIIRGNEEVIFLPLHRTHTLHPNRGGIGLALSSIIIARHGGYIWAENNSNGGASFNILI